MPKHDNHIRTLALEFSYMATTAGAEQWWQLWNAVELADPELAGAIAVAWKRYKPCFAAWAAGNAAAHVNAKECECRGACGEIGVAA